MKKSERIVNRKLLWMFVEIVYEKENVRGI